MMTMLPAQHPSRQRGFTLVEVIIVMVVTGILAGIVALFIRVPVLNYVDSKARAELSEAADTALRRVRRDVRLALPNSIRLSADGRSLEFILTKSGGRYVSADDGFTNHNALSFINPSDTAFEVIGAMPTGTQAIVANDSIVVYNLGSGFSPADAYSGGNIATVQSVNSATRVITLTANPFGAQAPAMESPTRRFQVVSGPVTYYCDSLANGGSGRLLRYDGYALSAVQASPPGGGGVARLADNVQSCEFRYDTEINEPRALVGMTLVLRDRRDSTLQVSLSHQVHVDNTP